MAVVNKYNLRRRTDQEKYVVDLTDPEMQEYRIVVVETSTRLSPRESKKVSSKESKPRVKKPKRDTVDQSVRLRCIDCECRKARGIPLVRKPGESWAWWCTDCVIKAWPSGEGPPRPHSPIRQK